MTGIRTAAIFLLIGILLTIGVCYLVPPASADLSEESITYQIDNNAIVNASDTDLTLENGTALPLGEKNIPAILHNIKPANQSGGGTVLVYNSANYAIRKPANISDLSRYPAYNFSQRVRINQGDCVYLGETIDISGGGWFTGKLNYYGIYTDDYSEGPLDTVVKSFEYSSKNASALWIDPAFFGKYPGWWYYNNHVNGLTRRWLETGMSPSSNDRAFFVGGDSCPKMNETKNLVQLAINETRIQNAIQANLSGLDLKRDELGADIIISKNVTTAIEGANAHRWTFGSGSDPAMYDVPIEDPQEFTKKETRDLPAGLYENVLVFPECNGLYDVRYDKDTDSLSSPFRDVQNLSVVGLQPAQVKARLMQRILSSYSKNYTMQRIDIQEPAITLSKFDQWQKISGDTIFTLAGYTNANPGDIVIVRLDANRTYPASEGARAWVTKASDNGGPGYYRAWAASFSIPLQNLPPGEHWISVDTNNGAHMDATFYVYNELKPHYQPEVFLKYIGSSPFVPPIYINTTVTIEVPGPTKYVYVDVTPKPEDVQAAADRAAWGTAGTILEWVFIGALVIGLLLWIYSAYRRQRS